MHSFEHTPQEARELLRRPIRDLGLSLRGSPLEGHVETLYRELAERGLPRFRPACYLSDEWACPDGEPIIGIPFYLADPKLSALECAVNDVEEGREILMYLRHEAGHAFNYAYRLFERKDFLDLFGPWDRPYRDAYTPVPFSRRFVRHMAGWYAQKHPDEDFAETFAVWLTPGADWRRRYAGWPALKKLEYVERIVRELADAPPRRALHEAVAELPVEEMSATVEDFYRIARSGERPLEGLAADAELEDIFPREVAGESRPASALLSEQRKALVDKIAYWTGLRRPLVKQIVEALLARVREMELPVLRAQEPTALVEFSCFATTLAMSYLARGSFAAE